MLVLLESLRESVMELSVDLLAAVLPANIHEIHRVEPHAASAADASRHETVIQVDGEHERAHRNCQHNDVYKCARRMHMPPPRPPVYVPNNMYFHHPRHRCTARVQLETYRQFQNIFFNR